MNEYNYIPNTVIQNISSLGASIGLRQIERFPITNSFKDSNGKQWKLVKSANDSGVEIPDPQYVQITNYWNHEFPNSNGKVFIYVVEGIKRPRIPSETSINVLYQWFSTNNVQTFTPQMITPQEWFSANVYVSDITDTRLSKLNALCNTKVVEKPSNKEPDIDISLLGVSNEPETNTTVRPITKSNKN